MITNFHVKNYKSLRDVSLALTPVHVLIGPNNSGKTSILEAIQALCRSVDHFLNRAFVGSWKGRELVWNGADEGNISFDAILHDDGGALQYHLGCRFNGSDQREVVTTGESINGEELGPRGPGTDRSNVYWLNQPIGAFDPRLLSLARRAHQAMTGVHYYRWDARMLALPTAPDSGRKYRMDPSGFGLALCLDDILGFDRVKFAEMENRFREIFPEIRSIKLVPEPAFRASQDHTKSTPLLQTSDGKGIYFQLENSHALIPASQASDGVLLVLAYLTILSLPEPPKVILIEEPENGIHPRRLKEVVSILRGFIKEGQKTQVLLTTHSPYLLDLFQPEEVTVCRRENGETKVSRLSESKSVREQMDIFSLGEIWTADGDDKIAIPVGQAT